MTIVKGKAVAVLTSLLALFVLAGCSQEEDEVRETRSVEVVSFASGYVDAETMTRAGQGAVTGTDVETMTRASQGAVTSADAETMTRAGLGWTRAVEPSWAPTGYFSYGDLEGTAGQMMPNTLAAIGAYFTQNGADPKLRRLAYNTATHTWYSKGYDTPEDEDVPPSGDYLLYGFVPFSAASSTDVSITGYGGTNATFDGGARITLNGLSSVSNKDLCVVVGARHGTKVGDADPVPASALQVGDFNCTIAGGENAKNHLFLLFDHLYAALRFRFRLDAEYAKLRCIKIRKLELMGYTDEDCTVPMKKTQHTTITLQANGTGANPIVDPVEFVTDTESGDLTWETLYDWENNREKEIALPKAAGAYTDNMGFVTETGGYYKLRVTFGVYDDTGDTFIHERTSENVVDPRKLFEGITLDRGHIYTIRFTVKPTYLFILADEVDLNSPTISIN